MFQDSFLNEVNEKGAYLVSKLKETFPQEKVTIRGEGLLIGLNFGNEEVGHYISKLEEEGLLVCGAGAHVLRLLPPLNVSYEEIDQAVQILKK